MSFFFVLMSFQDLTSFQPMNFQTCLFVLVYFQNPFLVIWCIYKCSFMNLTYFESLFILFFDVLPECFFYSHAFLEPYVLFYLRYFRMCSFLSGVFPEFVFRCISGYVFPFLCFSRFFFFGIDVFLDVSLSLWCIPIWMLCSEVFLELIWGIFECFLCLSNVFLNIPFSFDVIPGLSLIYF